jgi:hypothetical protein
MELIVQLFTYRIDDNDPLRAQKKQRQFEVNECFRRNVKNPVFSTIHILLERASDLVYFQNLIKDFGEKDKCNFVIFGRQPKYADFVFYAKTKIQDNKMVCIMNSDIYMGKTDINFIDSELDYNTLIALSRHEYTDDAHSLCDANTCNIIYRYHGSHDAFIFRTPVPKEYNFEYVCIPQNIGGSENIFMNSWVMSSKQLKNLCFDIPIFHMHKYRYSNYKTLATHTLCNVKPTVPKNRPDLNAKVIHMF